MSLPANTTLAIEAPIAKVWEVLTARPFTSQWTHEFTGNGKVTVLKYHELLRLTVAHDGKRESVVLEVAEHAGSAKTIIHVLRARNFQHANVHAWERVLPLIKDLAENR